jgi:hypothetical protein
MAEDPQLRSWGKGGFLESSSMLRTQGLNIVRGGEKRGIYQHAPSSGRVRWDNRDTVDHCGCGKEERGCEGGEEASVKGSLVWMKCCLLSWEQWVGEREQTPMFSLYYSLMALHCNHQLCSTLTSPQSPCEFLAGRDHG